MTIKRTIKHAFAVQHEDEGAPPTPEQQVPVDWVARQVAQRHLTTPASIGLEICKPLNFYVSMGLHFLGPAMWALTPPTFYLNYKQFAGFLERRDAFEQLRDRIEALEATYAEKEHRASEEEKEEDAR